MKRFFSKFNNSNNNNYSNSIIDTKQKLTDESLDYNMIDLFTQFYYCSQNLICDNIDLALQNICECLDDLTKDETKFKVNSDRILAL